MREVIERFIATQTWIWLLMRQCGSTGSGALSTERQPPGADAVMRDVFNSLTRRSHKSRKSNSATLELNHVQMSVSAEKITSSNLGAAFAPAQAR